jgi:hypothetical protein
MTEQNKHSAAESAIIRRKERERDNAEASAEAAENQLEKFFTKALDDQSTKQNVSKQCLDGFEGKLRGDLGNIDPATGQVRIDEPNTIVRTPWGDLDSSITGYEDKPGEDD